MGRELEEERKKYASSRNYAGIVMPIGTGMCTSENTWPWTRHVSVCNLLVDVGWGHLRLAPRTGFQDSGPSGTRVLGLWPARVSACVYI